MSCRRWCVLAALIALATMAVAQTATNTDVIVVPRLIKFSGTMAGTQGTVGVTFTLYQDQSGGAPLWQETQNVTPDANGRYTIYLGANHTDGVPLDLFSSGEARWLGIQPEGQAEQARVSLVSVPYAFAAGDAQTLGGKPISAFILAGNSTGTGTDGLNYVNTGAIQSASAALVTPLVTSGTAGYLGMFVDSSSLGNSAAYQSGGSIGINTTSPQAALHVVSSSTPAGIVDVYSNTLNAVTFVTRAARGTPASPAAVQAGDIIGGFTGRGWGTTGFSGGRGALIIHANEAWSDAAQGTYIQFNTTASGTAYQAERMRIDHQGNVGIGTTSPDSPLTVVGTIHSTTGGFRFPDNSVQTTAYTGGGNYTAGTGLFLNADQFSVNFNSVQQRVGMSCSGGSTISAINMDGTVVCQQGGGLTSVATDGNTIVGNGTGMSPLSVGSAVPRTNGTNFFNAQQSINVGGATNALNAQADGTGAFALQGQTNATDSQAAGVVGNAMVGGSSSARGVVGMASGSSGTGVFGTANGTNGVGISGSASGSSGIGVSGFSSSAGGAAGMFQSNAPGGDILRGVYNGNSIFRLRTNGSGTPLVQLGAPGMATSGSNGGVGSTFLSFNAQVVDSGSNQHTSKLLWRADPVNNGQNNYNAKLVFYSGMDSANASPTNLWINADGTINFASNQTFPGSGVTSVTAGNGLTGGGSGDVTLSADFTKVQPLLVGLTNASCGAGNAVGAINSNGSVSCVNLTQGGGVAYLPMSSGGQVTGNLSVIPPTAPPVSGTQTASSQSLQGNLAAAADSGTQTATYALSVTQTQQGPPPPNGPPTTAWIGTLPAAVLGTATDNSGNVSVGIIGQGTGAGDVGVVAANNGSDVPALFAFSGATGMSRGSAVYAMTSAASGKVIGAEATASAGPAPCGGGGNCDDLKVIDASADASSGVVTLFNGNASSPNASGIQLNFNSALQTNCAQGTQCPQVFSAYVNNVGSFSIDGGLNVNTPGNINANSAYFNSGLNVGGGSMNVNAGASFNGGLNVNGSNMNVSAPASFNGGLNVGGGSTNFSSEIDASGGIVTNSIGTFGPCGGGPCTLNIMAGNVQAVGLSLSGGLNVSGNISGNSNANFGGGLSTNGGGGITINNGALNVTGGGQNNFMAGNLTVSGGLQAGTLNAGSKNFKIDDPLDPQNKYLYHASIESSDMKNLYDGIVVLDDEGHASVQLPDWFEALNRDFRYSLTAIGAPAPNLYIAKEISGNRFEIAGGKPHMRVSWQVTGIRHDAYANAHRMQVEVEKPAAERGTYLYPEAVTPKADQPGSAQQVSPSGKPSATNMQGGN